MRNISLRSGVFETDEMGSTGPFGAFRDEDLRVPAIMGCTGAVLTVLVGSLTRPPSGGLFAWPLDTVRNAGVAGFLVMSVAALAVALLVIGWWAVVRVVRERPKPVRDTLWLGAWWALPFALGPAMFSRDIFSYSAQGEMVARGLNPSKAGPAALDLLGNGTNLFTQLSAPVWRHTPAPYGPLWFRLSGTIASVSGHDPWRANTLFRLVALVSVVVIAWCMLQLAHRYDVEPSRVLVLGLLNPIMLLHIVSGAHNEGLMLALMLFGLVAVAKDQRVLGVVIIGLAAAVKIPAIAAVVIVGWGWFGAEVAMRRKVWGVAIAGAISVVTLAVTSVATGLGFAWLATFNTPGQVRALGAPVASAGLIVEQITQVIGLDWSHGTIMSLVRLAGLALAAAISVVIVLRSKERVSIVSLGVLMLAVDLLGPALYPWYLIAPFVLLSYARRPWKEAVVIALTVVSAMLIKPSGAGVLYEIGGFGPWVMPMLVIAGMAWWFHTHGGVDPGPKPEVEVQPSR